MSAQQNAAPGAPAAAEKGESDRRWPRPGVFLVLVYVWWFVATPYIRFDFLGTIRFERVLVAVIAAALLFGGKVTARATGLTALLVFYYLWMLVGYLLSPYGDFPVAQQWLSNYWKLIVLYFLVLYSVRDLHDLFHVFAGITAISFLYQLHSWRDFLGGGSYVYQQGMIRMMGVWSGGDFGAPNAYGMLALFTIPFAFYWLRVTERRAVKRLMPFLVAMSCASILFSGTRGAFIGMVIMLVVIFKKRIFNLKILLVLTVAVSAVLAFLPEDYKHRYTLFVLGSEEEDASLNRFDQTAIRSGKGRIEGLVDGLKLGMRKPIFGYGAGTSEIARLEVREWDPNHQTLQLHNLYGQVVGETGFAGGFIFLLLITIYYGQLVGFNPSHPALVRHRRQIEAMRDLIRQAMLVLLIYGMFTHSLYRYQWPILFACQSALVCQVSRLIKDQGRFRLGTAGPAMASGPGKV